MKKNTMMRIASFLLIAVLLSTSAISGTYAKYVTANEGGDEARVAQWGVDIAVNGSLFAQSYDNTPEIKKDKDGNEIALTVVSSSLDNVVAPGTSNTDGLSFTITGTPEVAVNVSIQIDDVAKKDVYLADGTYADYTTAGNTTDTFVLATPSGAYRPLVYTLKNDADTELAKGTLEEIEIYLETILSANYPANTDLSTITGGTTGKYTLTWEWAFEQVSNIAMYDKADTLLGNLAAGTADDTGINYSTDAAIEFTITVTQID